MIFDRKFFKFILVGIVKYSFIRWNVLIHGYKLLGAEICGVC